MDNNIYEIITDLSRITRDLAEYVQFCNFKINQTIYEIDKIMKENNRDGGKND